MFKYIVVILLFLGSVSACKQKKKEPEKNFISALTILKGQVTHVDTSLYPIVRMEYRDGLLIDSVDMPRESFRAAAKDFLDIPDLSDKNVASRFKEEKLLDETIGMFIITYTPVDPGKEETQKQELLVSPNSSNDNINTILINRSVSNRDSSVQKNMLWQMDKYFQVTTIRQLPGQPEITTTVKVTWNEDKYR